MSREKLTDYVERMYDFLMPPHCWDVIEAVSAYLEQELLAVEEAQADTAPAPHEPVDQGTTTLDMLLHDYPWLAKAFAASYDRGWMDRTAIYDPRFAIEAARLRVKTESSREQ